MKKKVVCIVQERKNSIRFPSKILKKIKNKSILELLILRLKKSKGINQIVLATSNKNENKDLTKVAKRMNIKVFHGSENNVLDRYYKCSKKFNSDIIVRVTGDCPIIDPDIIDQMLSNFKKLDNLDYLSNTLDRKFPDGLDVEIFTNKALSKAKKMAKTNFDKEHVTSYFVKNNKFRKMNFSQKIDMSRERWTLDTFEDYKFIEKIYSSFKSIYFNHFDVMKLLKSNPKIKLINSNFNLNEGSNMSLGQKYWKRALNIIPGGNMFFSKRPEIFLPNRWPTYFKKAKGYRLWDLENKILSDFSYMGVGTNLLGYSNSEVDRFVLSKIKNGNVSTLNSLEDILLAEQLIEIHPWSEMVKLCRTGAEAAAIAVRISRVYNGKNNVVVCGYHGWHDWYLAANLKNKNNLNEHFIQGIGAEGVHKNLKNTIYKFSYNDFESLKKIIEINKNISAIVMEVKRNLEPKKNFLRNVRNLANKHNIVLIFDECTSGFRSCIGGLHLKYKIEPDICLFGKALGNGYPINAVIGKRDIMKEANKTFISSTFWSERLGPSAALKTIEIMKRDKTYNYIESFTKKIKKLWNATAKKNKIKIDIEGMDGIPIFNFKHKNNIYFKTYLTQQMLKKRILATNAIYLSISHDEKLLKLYKEILDEVFFDIQNCISGNKDINKILEVPVSKTSMRVKND